MSHSLKRLWNPSVKYISTTKSHLELFIESIIMFPVFQPIFAFQPMKLSALETTDKTGFKILLHFSGEIVGTRPLWKNINDCQLHLMEASFGAREFVCCVVGAVICCVSSPRWHYKCINCTAARIRHPTCHKMCSLKGFRSLKVSTLLIWRVSDSYWSGWIWELPGTSRPWPWRLRWPLTQQSCILGIVGKLILMYFSTSFTFSLFWQFLAACWLVW